MATGIEFWQLIQQGEPFDVAFLAMQMPQVDGLSLARLIHQKKYLPYLKMVMMSAIGCPVKLPGSDVASCLSQTVKFSQLYQVMMDLFMSLPALNSRAQSETQEQIS